jgi:hypothetical protein
MTTSLVTNDSPLFLTKVMVSDADYTTTLTNGLLIAYTALTAPRTVTLPPATTTGQIITVVDESGACNPTNIITIAGTVDGATNKTLNSPYSAITLESNGAGGYAILSKSDVSVTAPLTGNGTSVTPLAIPAATTSVNGYLTSTDWNTFNGKQPQLNGTGLVRMTGTSVSYDNSTYLTGTKVDSFNTRTGAVTLTSGDVTGALTYTPYNATNPAGYTTNLGTVTSVAALTLGTTGTDLSSTVANATTTPVITLNVPTASASNRGALSAADWTTFNGKQVAYTLLTTFGSLTNAAGFLKNNGSGVLSYDNTPQNTALWGSITGASAQAAPAGGWTGNHGAMSMGALSATTGSFTTITGTSFNSITGLASVAPLMDGTAAVGTSTLTARQDHVHPVDTSRQAQLNGTGFVKVSGTTVSYDNSTYLTGTKVDSFNTRTGAVTLTSSDVTTALTYTPINKAGDTGIGDLSMGALTATSSTVSGQLAAGSQIGEGPSVALFTNLGGSAYNPSVSAGDNAIIFSSGTYGTGNLVLGVWNGTGGVRIGSAGQVGMGALSATTGTFSGALTANNGMNVNRSNSASTGILYYSSGFTAWQTYMSNAGVASGVSGTVVAPTGTYVTTWGLRNFIENNAGYGWTWESGTNTSTTPSIVAELSSNTGNFRTIGSISATTGIFSGSVSQTPVAFASLPAGSAGMRAFVNNNSAGAAFGSAANGSGSTTYPVYHDGASWKIG